MPLYTIEIGSEPVLVFPEDSIELAREEAATGNVLEALGEFERDGAAVWDGKTPLNVREASEEEEAHFEAGFAEAVQDGDINEDERDEFAVFLIDTDDTE